MTVSFADPLTGQITEVKPGSFGLSRIGGLTGKLIAAGQAFSGDGSRWTHAFVVLDDETVVEAMPGGARIVPIADRLKHDEIAFADPVAEWAVTRRAELEALFTDEHAPTDPELFFGYVERIKREQIVDYARSLEGRGYGYLQYVALGLVALGFDPKWLRRYIASNERMICSQLVDEVYRLSGIKVFDDERLPQQVTPGDLANRFRIT